MAENKDTRAEILIVAGVLILLLFVWFRNKQAGVAPGVSLDLALPAVANGSTNSGVPLGLTLPDAASQAALWQPGAGQGINIGGTTYTLSDPTVCGCGGGSGGNTYGSEDDLAAALIMNGYNPTVVSNQQGNFY
jgi:hypothetical protein